MFSKVKTRERELARELRHTEGASIKEIARRTGAAQSSISRWVRDIELTDEQREALRIAAYHGHVKGRTMNALLRREARVMAQEEGRMLAAQGDRLFVTGCMLYWAEGAFFGPVERQCEIEDFWLGVAGLSRDSLCKSTVNVYSKYSKKRRQNKLPYGTCRVTVSRTRIVQSILGAIQEIGGFTRDSWLE